MASLRGKSMNYVDNLINRITMYRLLIYYLCGLLLAAMFFGAIGTLSYPPQMILLSASITVGASYVINYIFAKIYDAPSNTESALITGLILSLIITPMSSLKDVTFLLAASGLAIAAKYILAIGNKHIFNPAAIAVVLTAFGPGESASWWIGSAALLPFVLAGGLLIIRKIRRTTMVAIFFGAAVISVAAMAAVTGHDIATTTQTTFLHSSLFFLGFVMLTEPWTSPSTKNHRYIYAAIVGLLFSPLIHVGSIYSTPELALIVGNLYAFFVTPIAKTKVQIIRRRMYGANTEDIELAPEHPFLYKPGQYVEMTLPHKGSDARGARRYFTLASSPTEDTLHLGVRYYANGSSFKETLHNPDSTFMSFGQVGGDFTLPRDEDAKLAFIAGGIGVTPFRSMVKYLADTNDARPAILLYGERSIEDVAYREVFEEAQSKIGLVVRYVLGSVPQQVMGNEVAGIINRDLIAREVPDYASRIFYISGPQSMVKGVKKELLSLGVSRRNIKTDYFFGYA